MSDALNYLLAARPEAMTHYFAFLKDAGKHLDPKPATSSPSSPRLMPKPSPDSSNTSNVPCAMDAALSR